MYLRMVRIKGGVGGMKEGNDSDGRTNKKQLLTQINAD
jgi:hypothetical protein